MHIVLSTSYNQLRFPPVIPDLPIGLPTVTNLPLPGSREGSRIGVDVPSLRVKFNTAAICPLGSTGILIMFTIGSTCSVGLSTCPEADVSVDDDEMTSDKGVDTTSNVDEGECPLRIASINSNGEGGADFTTTLTSPVGNVLGVGESILIGKSIDATGLVTGTVTESVTETLLTSLLNEVPISGPKIGGGGASGS